MRVGLGQRGRDPLRPGGEHHRPGDVAAPAQHDIGTTPLEDAAARDRRTQRDRSGAKRGERRPARDAGNGERVELVSRLRREPRFGAACCSRERDLCPARSKRVRDRQSGQDVPCRPARRDQAPQRLASLHRTRC
jgi:hypothetical protein